MVRSLKISSTVVLGVAIAVPTLLALALYAWLFASAIERDSSRRHLIVLLYNWQTQVSGVFAISAALLGATAVLYQTGETRRTEKDRRARRAIALRAALPMVLDSIAEYLAACIALYSDIRNSTAGPAIHGMVAAFPELTDSIISNTVDYIETVGRVEGRPLVIFLRDLQKLRARTRDTGRRATGPASLLLLRANVVSRIVDTAEAYARCDALFIYARADDNSLAAPVGPEDVKTILRLLIANDPERVELDAEVDRRVKAANYTGSVWPLV